MALWRVRTTFTGPMVVGGGVQDFYFDSNVGTTQDAVDAAHTFWTAAHDCFRVDTIAHFPSEVTILGANGVITGIDSVTAPGNVSGVDDSDPLPPQTQMLVRWRTGQFSNGREVRGRTFIPSAGEATSFLGAPTASRVAALAAAANTLVTDTSAQLVVWSRTHQVAFPVDSSSVWSKFATLRSRRD